MTAVKAWNGPRSPTATQCPEPEQVSAETEAFASAHWLEARFQLPPVHSMKTEESAPMLEPTAMHRFAVGHVMAWRDDSLMSGLETSFHPLPVSSSISVFKLPSSPS